MKILIKIMLTFIPFICGDIIYWLIPGFSIWHLIILYGSLVISCLLFYFVLDSYIIGRNAAEIAMKKEGENMSDDKYPKFPEIKTAMEEFKKIINEALEFRDDAIRKEECKKLESRIKKLIKDNEYLKLRNKNQYNYIGEIKSQFDKLKKHITFKRDECADNIRFSKDLTDEEKERCRHAMSALNQILLLMQGLEAKSLNKKGKT
jgi:hypothetical protein